MRGKGRGGELVIESACMREMITYRDATQIQTMLRYNVREREGKNNGHSD